MDGKKGLITFDSLEKNKALLWLQDFEGDEIESVIKKGNLDGDGALN